MASNLSVIQHNICHALDDDTAEKCFLAACEHLPVRCAEDIAFEIRAVARFLDMALPLAACKAVPEGVREFILRRFWFERIGKGRPPW